MYFPENVLQQPNTAYRLIKFTPNFPSTGTHFSDHNSDEIYFSSLNVIIFFIISDKIHISSLKRYF